MVWLQYTDLKDPAETEKAVEGYDEAHNTFKDLGTNTPVQNTGPEKIFLVYLKKANIKNVTILRFTYSMYKQPYL